MNVSIIQGDAIEMLRTLPDASVNCCITSPPYYGLRDYGVDGQLGLERTPEEYVSKLVAVFQEVRRVLLDDGTLWLNLGDSYAGSGKGSGGTYELSTKQNSNRGSHYEKDSGEKIRFELGALKPKDLIGIPWRVAFALQADGWYLRQDIIWAKPNPMPESVRDRCTKAHEYVFMLSKQARYYYDAEAIKEDSIMDKPQERIRPNGKMVHCGALGYSTSCGSNALNRNRRSVWSVATAPYKEAHFATFPPALIKPMVMAGCPEGGTVLDPFAGSGTTGMVAENLGRNSILIELNPKYIELIEKRTAQIGIV